MKNCRFYTYINRLYTLYIDITNKKFVIFKDLKKDQVI